MLSPSRDSCGSDQELFNRLRSKRPSEITLDFHADIVLNMWRLHWTWDLLLEMRGKSVWNRWLEKEVCFMHFNGVAKRVKYFVEMMISETLKAY